jgi:hypothetical protein
MSQFLQSFKGYYRDSLFCEAESSDGHYGPWRSKATRSTRGDETSARWRRPENTLRLRASVIEVVSRCAGSKD